MCADYYVLLQRAYRVVPRSSAAHRLFDNKHEDHRAAEQEQQVDAEHRARLLLYLVRLIDLDGRRRDLWAAGWAVGRLYGRR